MFPLKACNKVPTDTIAAYRHNNQNPIAHKHNKKRDDIHYKRLHSLNQQERLSSNHTIHMLFYQ